MFNAKIKIANSLLLSFALAGCGGSSGEPEAATLFDSGQVDMTVPVEEATRCGNERIVC